MSSYFPDVGTTAPRISPEALKRRLDAGEQVTILDTRRPADFEEWRIEHPNGRTVNVSFDRFLTDEKRPVERIPDGLPEVPLVVNCAKGVSSQFVGDVLVDKGREVEVLEDGMRGWARLLEAIPLDVEAPARVVQYHRPASGCLGYVVYRGDEAVVVDPLRAFVDRYVADARERGAEITRAVDTHVHADHVSGTRRIAERTGASLVVPEGALDRGLSYDEDEYEYETVGDGDEIPGGDAALTAVALPGHTTEMTGFRVGNVLISGDTLFARGVARPDLETGTEGTPEAAGHLYDTLQDLAELPDDLVVAPGHTSSPEPTGPDGSHTAVLGDLRDRLVAFRMDRAAFVDHVVSNVPPRPNNYERIIDTNLGLDDVDDSAAFELELGPNNCAAAD